MAGGITAASGMNLFAWVVLIVGVALAVVVFFVERTRR
jgi:hypothetical protein